MTTSENHGEIGAGDSAVDAVVPFSRRAPRISQADVFRAADELLVQGDRPTIDRVRMRLGRGSPNTINDHLDAWWLKLGARLRDIPGREFPQLPERVAASLQNLWNTALEGAHEVLQGSLANREQIVTHRELMLLDRARELNERERAIEARAISVEESLTLAREQLGGSQRRIEQLETDRREHDAEAVRLKSRVAELDQFVTDLRSTLDSTSAAHQLERTRLEERHAATEARWLSEVDLARQKAKESATELERVGRDLRTRIDHLMSERDELRGELLESRSELKTATAVRQQMEERFRELTKLTTTPSSRGKRAGPSRHIRRKKRLTSSKPK